MEKKCRECRFNVRKSPYCRVKDRLCEQERRAPWYRFDRCGSKARWYQPKVARKRKAVEGEGREVTWQDLQRASAGLGIERIKT